MALRCYSFARTGEDAAYLAFDIPLEQVEQGLAALKTLGAGGAATAICVQAALDGAAEIAIFNRDDEFFANGRHTVEKLAQTMPGCKASITPLEDGAALADAVRHCDILVNATRVGMKPLDGETLVDPALFRADLVVADTVYNPRETRMIREARAAGCQAAVGGIGMLLWQGVAAFRLFTGRDMPAQEVLEKFFSYSYYQARAKGGFGLITIESTVEKDSELGGNFRIASYPTGKGQISEAIRSMIVRAEQAGVNIRLNTEATEEPLRALAPDAVILATGSVPLVLPIPGLADCGYVTAQDLLLGKTAAGRRALVVGGGMVGCEAAEYLAERGHQVAIVEMKDVIAADVTPENRRYMFRNFEENHVLLQPGAKAPGNAVLATGDALEAALAI